jgi:hypothetical protein
MKYFTTDQEGITLVDPSSDERLRLLESVLINTSADFPEVFLTGSDGNVLGYRSDGCLFWEEAGIVSKFIPRTDVQEAIRAWDLLISSGKAGLDSLDWVKIEATE